MSTTYEYDRAYLTEAIPECDPANVGDGTQAEREEFAAKFDEVLDAIRAEFLPSQDGFTESQVTEAVHIASEAWDAFCERQGDVGTTRAWLAARWDIRA